MNYVLSFIGFGSNVRQMPPPVVQPKNAAADDFYKRGLACIEEQHSDKRKSDTEDYDRFAPGVEYLKRAADNGHEEAPALLRSLCDSFAREEIDTRSDHATWFRFKTVLFAAYQPWEQFAVLQEYPHVLDTMPQALRKEIYQSTVEAASQGNQDARNAKWLMEAKGFGVAQSFISELRILYLAKKERAEFKKLEAMRAPGAQLPAPQQKFSQLTDEELDKAIQEIETELLSILNKVPDGQNEKVVSETKQLAVVEDIRSQKQSLSIQERLSFTYADIAHWLPQLINDIKPQSGYLTNAKPGSLDIDPAIFVQRFAQGLAKCKEEGVQIVTEEPALPPDLWGKLFFMTAVDNGEDALSLCNRALFRFRESFGQTFLHDRVVVPKGYFPWQLAHTNRAYLKREFIPDVSKRLLKTLLPEELLSKSKQERLFILHSFFESVKTTDGDIDKFVEGVEKLICDAWFQDKVKNGLIKFDEVLLFPLGGYKLGHEKVSAGAGRSPIAVARNQMLFRGFLELPVVKVPEFESNFLSDRIQD